MLVKIVSVFLIFIAVLGILGKLSLLRWLSPFRSRKTVKQAQKCPSCGRYRLADETCTCGGST